MQTISKTWESYYAKLKVNQVDPKCPEENEVVRRTMGPWRYKEHAEMIINEINVQDSILEIGCGFGGLAQEILKKINVSYTVVDNEIMLNQAKRFLADTVEYIEAKKIETLQGRKFGLFISNFCLSEVPPEYQKYVVKNIICNCQVIFIIDRTDNFIGEELERQFTIKKTQYSKDQSIYIGRKIKKQLGIK